MNREKITFAGFGGIELPGIIWLPETEPKLILHIAHGMTEHIGRYDTLAQALCDEGMAVAGFDLRGHGENPCETGSPSFGQGGWDAALEDMHLFYQLLDARFPGLPHVLMGFSLGSFLTRDYMNHYNDEIAGTIILGSGQQPGAVMAVMKAVAKTQIRKAGFDHTTPLVEKLSFENYNNKFKPNRTNVDWLCADEAQVDAFKADPLNRGAISSGLFWQLLDSMKRTGGRHAYDKWPKDVPVLLISGGDDPVGDQGRGVEKIASAMKKAGLSHVEMLLFPGARHDLLHEEVSGNADRARKAIIHFLKGLV